MPHAYGHGPDPHESFLWDIGWNFWGDQTVAAMQQLIPFQRFQEPVYTGTEVERSSPTFFPSLGETCFLRPDGEIACVTTGSIWESEHRSKGWPEVPADTPYVSPAEPVEVARLPYEPIPTDVEGSVFEPEKEEPIVPGLFADVLDWGQAAIDLYTTVTGPQPQIYSPYPAPANFANVNTPPSGGSDMDVCAPGYRRKRRRRRPLLTPTDLNTLAALKTITGNNDALKFAVMKAVRR